MASKIAVFDRIPLFTGMRKPIHEVLVKKLKNSSALKKTALYND